jgi:hypothetical protein
MMMDGEEPPVFPAQLPRLYELRDLIADPTSPDAFFQDFENKLQHAEIRCVYERHEKSLRGLDDNAWSFLKSEATPYLTTKDAGRGWHQLFDILYQAHAYNYLTTIGTLNVRFIPRSSIRTPDLEGVLNSDRVLCEVKTLNISEKEVGARQEIKARKIRTKLDEGFLNKLHSDITTAKKQMRAYDPREEALNYVYIIPCFDNWPDEYKEEFFQQIDQYLLNSAIPGVSLVFRNEHGPHYNELSMTAATVDNAGSVRPCASH